MKPVHWVMLGVIVAILVAAAAFHAAMQGLVEGTFKALGAS